jgi:hypothetical protein
MDGEKKATLLRGFSKIESGGGSHTIFKEASGIGLGRRVVA